MSKDGEGILMSVVRPLRNRRTESDRIADVRRNVNAAASLENELCLRLKEVDVRGAVGGAGPVGRALEVRARREGAAMTTGTLGGFRLLFEGALGGGSYGVAFRARGGDAGFPLAAKIAIASRTAEVEGKVGARLTRAVLEGACPNILCTFGHTLCRGESIPGGLNIPERYERRRERKGAGYTVILTELASLGDLFTSVMRRAAPTSPISRNTYVGVCLQHLFALRVLHAKGLVHTDNHCANVLIDDMPSGTGQLYSLGAGASEAYRVPRIRARGRPALVLLADFGMAKGYTVSGALGDIYRACCKPESWEHAAGGLDADVENIIARFDGFATECLERIGALEGAMRERTDLVDMCIMQFCEIAGVRPKRIGRGERVYACD